MAPIVTTTDIRSLMSRLLLRASREWGAVTPLRGRSTLRNCFAVHRLHQRTCLTLWCNDPRGSTHLIVEPLPEGVGMDLAEALLRSAA